MARPGRLASRALGGMSMAGDWTVVHIVNAVLRDDGCRSYELRRINILFTLIIDRSDRVCSVQNFGDHQSVQVQAKEKGLRESIVMLCRLVFGDIITAVNGKRTK